MSEARSEYKLKNPPDDAISSVRFAPKTSYVLIVSSWDSYVRLYDVLGNTVRTKYTHNQSPVLDTLMTEANRVFSGALDGTIISCDITGDQKYTVGQHEDAVRCLEFSEDKNIIASGSWDRLVKLWDARSLGPIGVHSQQDQVYTMSVKDEMLIVGTSSRKIIVWDLRNMSQPFQQRDSLLKYQTRCVRIFPNKQGYVLSSIEGRVAVEYFDSNPEVQKKKYAFKCHRIKEQGMECIYPVNAISFHFSHSTFATGGADGFVNVWDGFNKKRLCQFHRYPTGISSLAFSNCGSVLAIGCSYLGELDETPQPALEDCIFIRNVTDQETKPK
ncbi:Mitotic checkpoint protein BUB3 [Orchesella cincta]|uniref:Mitotic checkpoint protein BUB3 n=1 Tax=Orchesella cincta TaxID=48709 RepID=A0A1D2N8I6_ORCCI|nr:Mitotic checkpoint protein BUB3 [Orchesella cincta]